MAEDAMVHVIIPEDFLSSLEEVNLYDQDVSLMSYG